MLFTLQTAAAAGDVDQNNKHSTLDTRLLNASRHYRLHNHHRHPKLLRYSVPARFYASEKSLQTTDSMILPPWFEPLAVTTFLEPSVSVFARPKNQVQYL
ncbi:hypothetical protein MPSEU_000822300 [Mayamaea pseudoterrestris]|nr:hypothetical protein MPSEU_000822300 [Mayamaea pseudoterrestris]